jgi:EAL domain-containing protein (putative c-di-GMP-specific phosphodiesterase class I)
VILLDPPVNYHILILALKDETPTNKRNEIRKHMSTFRRHGRTWALDDMGYGNPKEDYVKLRIDAAFFC